MQIQLTQNDVASAVRSFIEHEVFRSGFQYENLTVEFNDDGGATVYVDEDTPEENAAGGTDTTKPKRTRRTKQQIEADRLAEEAAKEAASKEEQGSLPLEEPADTQEEDSKPVVEPVEEAPVVEPVEEKTVTEELAEETPPSAEPVEEAPVRKSLFGGLRQPVNG